MNRKWLLFFFLILSKAGCSSNSNNTTRVIQLTLVVYLLHTSTMRSPEYVKKTVVLLRDSTEVRGRGKGLKDDGNNISATIKIYIEAVDAKKGHA